MESLPRPRHRKKHSTTATNASSSSAYSSLSFKNPYDDALLPKGGKAKFEAHEYAEIFSGSSSIPVLDLSGLNEHVGPADFRSSKLDYSNIFGGFGDDDVALPYEQLFNGAHKKTKTRIPADVELPFQQHGSVNSSGKTKNSSGASDQSIDGINQQFNMAFNKTSQRNSDESNGKTHIAQLHAVSGFTHFVDETPLQNKEHKKPNPSMKREVSRTWSFSSGVEHIPFKGGITLENSHTPDKSSNVIGINLKSHTSKGAQPSSQTSSPNDSKYLRQSKLPSFASKDACRNSAGEYSPPLLDEELDENSVAAVSAAALKKAIEQARQSINTAKMIMEKRKEGIRDGLDPRSKSCSKVKNKKETGIHALKENNVSETDGILDSMLPKFTRNGILNARKAKVGMVRENVESANDLGDAFAGVEKKLTPSCSQSDILYTEKEAELKNAGQNAGPTEPHGETMSFTRFVANAKCRTSNFDSGKVDTCIEQMETGNGTLEKREETVLQPEGLETVSEMAESGKSTSESRQGLEKIVDEAYEQCQKSFNHIGPKSIDEQLERVVDCSGRTHEQEKIMHEGGENNVSVDKEICENRFVGHKESVCTEQLTVLKSEIHDLQNESQNQVEEYVMDQADMDKKPENVCELKEDGQDGTSSDEEENGMVLEDEHQWFESEMQLAEPVEEEISYLEPEIYQEEEDGIKVHTVNESEIVDEKLNHEHEEDGQYAISDRHVDRPECEAAETLLIEIDNYCEVLNVEEMNYTHKEGGSEDLDKSELYGKNIDETADAHCNISDTISSDGCRDTTGAVFTVRPEPSDVDINNELQDYQADGRCCKENDSFSLGPKMCLAVEDDEVDDMPGIGSLRRCASEEKFTEGQPHSTFEDLSSDSKSEDVDLMDADCEEIIFEAANEIHNTAQEYASKINLQHSPEFHNVDDEAREFDDRSAKAMSERTSESDEESPLTSIIENIDEVSTQESQAFRENLKDGTSIEERQDRLVMTSDEKEYVGEQSEGVHLKDKSGYSSSSSNCEPKEMHESMEAEREAEKGEDMEKEKENQSRTSSTGQKDAQGNDQKIEANDHQQRIEAIKRGREREKDRLAVERAIREARERAFAEARQRAMAEAREKLEKATVETKTPVDKVSNEAKLRAERAAVERATAEARERALEKAMSQKTYAESRTQAEKYSAERFSSSSRNNGLKHSFSSSDLEKFDGASSESAQRRKARLERHQRIMERAAKALAEKNMRDILAQKEQAERNRLAESLDADIKRWATGKEGNLRALLSTLQYILGPDSGWQPVSLTEIITTAAVKKAYRKATLCVHPDKLQQRGATVQQKYICEKVFDLLKAAWNRFNSEER